jgi:hypothetical protein
MSTQTISTPLASLPARLGRRLSEKYYSRTMCMFVLHGNVHDLVPLVKRRSRGVRLASEVS